jgi:Cu/Ag efflux protein CusF
MTHLTKVALSILSAISLAACNGEPDPTATADHGGVDHAEMDHSEMDPKSMGPAGPMEGEGKSNMGQTTGTLVSVSPDGQSATIQHEAIDGVGMGAMTMGFEITSRVDLSAFTAGDPVSFRVKRGLDGSYRITAICNTDTDGENCLPAQMDHAER